jgi:hypothetical protein
VPRGGNSGLPPRKSSSFDSNAVFYSTIRGHGVNAPTAGFAVVNGKLFAGTILGEVC